MYHSVTFGDKNTWDDWRLVPASRPLFAPPKQKTKTLDIPGGDGLIDLSESLTGYPIYNNRTGSMEFIVMNDFKPWQAAYSDIMDYLHGKVMRAVLEDDHAYYYEGRFSVNTWKSEKNWSRIVIDYNVGPYKWSIQTSIGDWIWDTFNFQNGVIKPTKFKDIPVTTVQKSLVVEQAFFGRAPVCPLFRIYTTSGRGISIRFINSTLNLDITKQLSDGVSQIPEFVFYGDQVTILMSCLAGTGTVSVEFREGRL